MYWFQNKFVSGIEDALYWTPEFFLRPNNLFRISYYHDNGNQKSGLGVVFQIFVAFTVVKYQYFYQKNNLLL